MGTCSSCFDAGFAARMVAVAGLALVCFVALPPARAQDGGACESGYEEQPAAGHWTGTYRLAYELVIPNMPGGIPVHVSWEGELSFDLGRTETDAIQYPPPSPPRRRPLGVKPPASSLPPSLFVDCCNEEQAAAILAAEQQREAANEAQVRALLQWYADNLPPQHLYVPPDSKAVIKGVAQVRNQTRFAGSTAGVTAMRFDSQGTAPVDYDIKGEETDPGVGFTEIELFGIVDLMDSSATATATGRGASVRTNATVDRDGIRGNTQLQGAGRTMSVDYSGANPTTPGEKTKFASLTIESRKCWELRGTVDESLLRQLYQANGVSIRGVESEWTATLDERDEAWEKQVDELAAEPIPAELTWEYIDSFARRGFALRGSARFMSDYKRCVLKKLEEKFVRINLAGLRVYVANFPKVDEGATCGVMRAALQRMLVTIRTLQLYGMADCPVLEQARKVVEHEVQLLVRQTLSRKYTMRDLECFIGVYRNGMLDFGDQAAAFGEALNAMVQAAANARQ